MKPIFSSFTSGLLFALGLGVAGMTQPAKVLGFLDVAGAWDPSLALVMVGAIGVHAFLLRAILCRSRPLAAERFLIPPRGAIDGRVLAGAAVFGVGWGLGGYCPGPALVSIASGRSVALVFVVAMLVGMKVAGALQRSPAYAPRIEVSTRTDGVSIRHP